MAIGPRLVLCAPILGLSSLLLDALGCSPAGSGDTASDPLIAPGTPLSVELTAPALTHGQATVTLESARSQLLGVIEPGPPDGDPQGDLVIAANDAAADDRALATATAPLTNGALQTAIHVPPTLPNERYFLKVHADDGVADAFGSAEVRVETLAGQPARERADLAAARPSRRPPSPGRVIISPACSTSRSRFIAP